MKKFKVILSAGIALCIGVSSLSTAFAAEKITHYKIGDFDANQRVDVSDVTALQMQLAGYESIEEGPLGMADFNGDGCFDVSDVTETQKMVAGLDYNCFVKADETFKEIESEDIPFVKREEPLTEEEVIEYEELYNWKNLILTNYECEWHSELYIIRNQDEFYSVFGAYSPNFDDEYFKDYALIAWLNARPEYNDVFKLTAIGSKDDALYLDFYEVNYQLQSPMPAYHHALYKVKQSDISNVNTISNYSYYKYVSYEDHYKQ